MAKKNSSSTSNTGKRAQSFAFTAPEAMSVQLVGDFTQWQQNALNMQKDSGGVWRVSVELGRVLTALNRGNIRSLTRFDCGATPGESPGVNPTRNPRSQRLKPRIATTGTGA